MTVNRKLVDVLLDLHKNQRSGILRAEQGPEKKQLVLNKGTLTFAESNVPQEHLARVMVAIDILQRTHLKDITELMKTGKSSEEAALTVCRQGIQDLEKGRREQAIVILSSLLGCDGCSLRFYPGESLMKSHTNHGIALPELLVLSARRAATDRIVKPPADFLTGRCTVSENAQSRASNFPLDSTESYLLSLAQDSAGISDIFSLLPPEKGKPDQVLLCLYILGLIDLTSEHREGGDESSALARQLEEMLLRFNSASPYEVLSVSKTASQGEIQAAYYERAKQLHPDRFQSDRFSADLRSKAQQVFVQINDAYLTLKTADSRAAYDRAGRARPDHGPKSMQPEQSAEALFREGRAALAQGDFTTAVQRLKSCVWLCPDKAAYNHYLGVAESEFPNLRKKAEQHLLRAIEIEDVSAESHLELAKLYLKVMLPRKAEYQLKEALRWDPGNSEAQKLFTEVEKLL